MHLSKPGIGPTQLAGLLSTLLALPAIAQMPAPAPAPGTIGPSGSGVNNALLYAVAWTQTAAEVLALYYQGFNIATMHVQAALAKRQPGDKPLAVVTNMHDTILYTVICWGHLINQNKDFLTIRSGTTGCPRTRSRTRRDPPCS